MMFDAACAARQRKHWRTRCSQAPSRSTILRALGLTLLTSVALGGCAGNGDEAASGDARVSRPTRKFTDAGYSARIVDPGAPVPKGGGAQKLGAPYKMCGRWYVPRHEPGYDAAGIGSWYGEDFHGRRTANGEIYDMHALSAAHPTLPLPSYAWVTNQQNGRTILVRVNDRGPYAHDRVIDLSRAAARELGYETQGTGQVRVRYAGPAPLDGNDARERQVLASAPWRTSGPRLAANAPMPAPAWERQRPEVARPAPRPVQAAVSPPPPRVPYASADRYAGRDDYAALQARSGAPQVASPAPAPRGAAPAVEPTGDAATAADTPSWSLSGYRQSIAGQRRSLGGP